jgi:imidazolonepropionase-like amidohydrolase
VIEAKGLHVYPGLINADTGLGLVEIPSVAATNDTRELANFQPDVRAVSGVSPHSSHIGVAACEGITTAAVRPEGGYISGGAGLIQLAGWTMPEMLRNVELGLIVDLPSLPTELEAEDRNDRLKSHKETIQEIETFIKDAQHYAKIREMQNGGDRVYQAVDVKLEAKIPYVTGEKRVFFAADSYKEILEAVRFAEAFELDPVIIGAMEAWQCADMLAEKNIPVIVNSIYAFPASEFVRYDARYANPGMLEKAGVDFCIATGGSEYARRLPVHAGMAVAHGLTPDAAVRSITLDAARILGVEKEIGSIEQGKIADVIITTGHPCQASTRTVASFIAGQPIELTSKHEESYQRFTNRPAPKLPAEPENPAGPPPMRVGAQSD